jgi:hypothetical protein
MSTIPTSVDPVSAQPPRRVVNASSLLGAAAVSTLIGSQLVTVTGAFVYSVVMLLRLSPALSIGLSLVLGALSLWALGSVVLMAFRAETDPANN